MSDKNNNPVATAPGTDIITHEIDLVEGYADPRGAVHKHVVFGKSVTAKRLLTLRVDKLSDVPTQYADLLLSESIVEFGTTPIPVPLTTLLQLVDIDREDLRAGRDEFRKKVLGDRTIEIRDEGVTLAFGIKLGALRYTIVEFGNRVTGKDEVSADKLGLTEDLARRLFLAGRMIKKISTPEGNEIAGPVEYETLNSDDLDEDDLWALVVSADLWRQSFRTRGRSIAGNGVGQGNSGSKQAVSVDDGRENSVDADRAKADLHAGA